MLGLATGMQWPFAIMIVGLAIAIAVSTIVLRITKRDHELERLRTERNLLREKFSGKVLEYHQEHD